MKFHYWSCTTICLLSFKMGRIALQHSPPGMVLVVASRPESNCIRFKELIVFQRIHNQSVNLATQVSDYLPILFWFFFSACCIQLTYSHNPDRYLFSCHNGSISNQNLPMLCLQQQHTNVDATSCPLFNVLIPRLSLSFSSLSTLSHSLKDFQHYPALASIYHF